MSWYEFTITTMSSEIKGIVFIIIIILFNNFLWIGFFLQNVWCSLNVFHDIALWSKIATMYHFSIENHSGNNYFLFITANILEINNRGDSRINEGKRGGWGEKWEYLPTENRQTIKQSLNSKTEATLILCGSSGERANYNILT